MVDLGEVDPATEAASVALKLQDALDARKHFALEAGAGSGKTQSLVEALAYLISKKPPDEVTSPSIACLTYTNVAKNEIISRIDNHPAVFCETLHGFCWELIRPFQSNLRALVQESSKWERAHAEGHEVDKQPVKYDLGFRRIEEDAILLHHDDILTFTISLLTKAKFRAILAARFPVILIDEYQDTDKNLMAGIVEHLLPVVASKLVVGLFGDSWQRIYDDGCGAVNSPLVATVEKRVNYRSASAIVDSLARMRPQLPQFASRSDYAGSIRVFHTNSWAGVRRTENHWKGDLPANLVTKVVGDVRAQLVGEGWFSQPGNHKTLMLTHRLIAAEQGYSSFPTIYRRNEAFSKLEDAHLKFFVEHIEPACAMFAERQYGAMFSYLGRHGQIVQSPDQKKQWAIEMEALIALRQTGKVSDILAMLRGAELITVPDALDRREKRLEDALKSEEQLRSSMKSLQELRELPYGEVISLANASLPLAPYSTKHGVKGAEYDDVLVVAGGGWNQYNYNEMLTLARNHEQVPPKRLAAFERTRNLFYVACSRARNNLAIVFTQELDQASIASLQQWFGEANVTSYDFS